MTPIAYYNEHDPEAAAWLRALIEDGLIAYGVVDERSIEDVRPSDLEGYTQCHFFAGLGGWSYALRLAGVPDTARVWSASCPCQPFSEAGKGDGFDDERHLWPHFHWLVTQCKPDAIVGEQSSSKGALPWIDLVQADLQGSDYSFGVVDTCSAGYGAPHIRQRTYWMGHANNPRLEGFGGYVPGKDAHRSSDGGAARPAAAPGSGLWLADANRLRQQPQSGPGLQADTEHDAQPCGDRRRMADASSGGLSPRRDGYATADEGYGTAAERGGPPGWLAYTNRAEPTKLAWERTGPDGAAGSGACGEPDGCGELHRPELPGPTNGFWRDVDWLYGRDAKWRPARPGAFPLAHGIPHRVPLLRAAGNALNAEQAKGFIEAVLETLTEGH